MTDDYTKSLEKRLVEQEEAFHAANKITSDERKVLDMIYGHYSNRDENGNWVLSSDNTNIRLPAVGVAKILKIKPFDNPDIDYTQPVQVGIKVSSVYYTGTLTGSICISNQPTPTTLQKLLDEWVVEPYKHIKEKISNLLTGEKS